MKLPKGSARFWYEFIIGEDSKIAAAVVVALATGAIILVSDAFEPSVFAPLAGSLLIAGFVVSLLVGIRRT